MNYEEEQKRDSKFQKFIIIGCSIMLVGFAVLFMMPTTTKIILNESSTGYVWAEAEFKQDFGLVNHDYNVTIDKVKCDSDGHCYYGQAFYKQMPKLCNSKPFENCKEIILKIIDDGNFAQQAGELNLTKNDLQEDGCYDNGKYAHCRNSAILEEHLKKTLNK